jgi:hypothetical protein
LCGKAAINGQVYDGIVIDAVQGMKFQVCASKTANCAWMLHELTYMYLDEVESTVNVYRPFFVSQATGKREGTFLPSTCYFERLVRREH